MNKLDLYFLELKSKSLCEALTPLGNLYQKFERFTAEKTFLFFLLNVRIC